MNQCNKSFIQNYFKSQRTISFVSGAQQSRLNMEKNEQQQQTEPLKQRGQLSFFSKWRSFSSFFRFCRTLRWNDHCTRSLMRCGGMVHAEGANEQELMSSCTWAHDVILSALTRAGALTLLGGQAPSAESKAFRKPTKRAECLSSPTLTQSNEIYSRVLETQPSRPCLTDSQQSWAKSFQAAQFQLAVIALIRHTHSNKSTFWYSAVFACMVDLLGLSSQISHARMKIFIQYLTSLY